MPQPLRPSALGAAPGPTFEQPFEMLEACHERMQRMLVLLERLQEHLRTHGADRQAQQAASDIMRYFDLAAPEHHRDEELHVFPSLLDSGDPGMVAVVQRLRDDHRRMESDWLLARKVLRNIEAGGQPTADERAALAAFAGPYAGHLAVEEEIAYPAVRALLDGKQLAAMGAEMGVRRDAR